MKGLDNLCSVTIIGYLKATRLKLKVDWLLLNNGTRILLPEMSGDESEVCVERGGNDRCNVLFQFNNIQYCCKIWVNTIDRMLYNT